MRWTGMPRLTTGRLVEENRAEDEYDAVMTACPIEWLTIPAPDLEAAETFYAKVFGFSISAYSPSYKVFKAGNLSGGLDRDLAVAAGGIGFSVTVADMRQTLNLLGRYGGQLLKEPYSLGAGAGSCAMIADPNGNRLELYCASESGQESEGGAGVA